MAREATITLSGNRTAKLRMPNMYALLAKVGTGAPNPAFASIMQLLEGAGAIETPNLLQKMVNFAQYSRGLYEVAALCLVEPRLRLDGEPQAGEIGPEDLAWGDLYDIYFRFFQTDPPPQQPYSGLFASGVTLSGADAGGPAPATPDGDDLPDAAVGTTGD